MEELSFPPESESFKAERIDIFNVKREIEMLAKAWHCSESLIDFDILECKTRLGGKIVEKVETEELVQPKNISQRYNILFYKKPAAQVDALYIQLISNIRDTQVAVAILEGSRIGSLENDIDQIRHEINKALILEGYLINIFSAKMEQTLFEIGQRIGERNSFAVKNPIRFIALEGVEPQEAIDGEARMHYLEKKAVEDDRIDHASRDYIIEVKEGEVLIEFIRAQRGVLGRDCKGQTLGDDTIEPTYYKGPEIDPDTIDVVKDEKGKRYIAKRDGYIYKDARIMQVETTLIREQISFKSTGSLSASQESVSIKVGRNCAIEDAIGMGVTVEAEQVDVKGNIGSSSRVLAKEVFVGGRTHKKSFIQADNAVINIHSGTLQVDQGKIARLEMGAAEGKKLAISHLFGGEVSGKSVEIGKMYNRSKVHVSQEIFVKEVEGIDNIVKISSATDESTLAKLKEIKEDIKESEQALNRELNEYNAKKETFAKASQELEGFKEIINRSKSKNIPVPESVKRYLQRCKKARAELEVLDKSIKQQERHILGRKEDMALLQNGVLNSVASFEVVKERDNFLEFHIAEPKQVIRTPIEAYTVYRLVEEEGDFRIDAKKMDPWSN